MLVSWVETDRPIDEFWDLTFYEIAIVFEGVANVRSSQTDLAYYTAYMSGVFSQPYKSGKFPDYEKHAPRKNKPKKMSEDAMKNVAMMITLALGGKIE